LNSSSDGASHNDLSESLPPGGSRTRRLGTAFEAGNPTGSSVVGVSVVFVDVILAVGSFSRSNNSSVRGAGRPQEGFYRVHTAIDFEDGADANASSCSSSS